MKFFGMENYFMNEGVCVGDGRAFEGL